MNLTTEQHGAVAIVRIHETRVMYPMLGEFSDAIASLVAAGQSHILVDLAAASYVDSATIGCMMDCYRLVKNAGGQLKLSGVQKRVETMFTMTGAQNFIPIHADEPTALASFGD
jgi:anti-anti-sigma factor